MIALAALLAAGLALRDVQERARQNDPRVQQALAQVQNAQAKRDEVQLAWFPSIETTAFVAGPTPEHYLKGGAYDSNPTDPTHVRTLDFGGQLGVQLHFDAQAILPLYTFGKWTAGKSATQHLVGAQEALLSRARDQASFDAARAFWGYQAARNAGETVQKIRDRLDEAKRTAAAPLGAQGQRAARRRATLAA